MDPSKKDSNPWDPAIFYIRAKKIKTLGIRPSFISEQKRFKSLGSGYLIYPIWKIRFFVNLMSLCPCLAAASLLARDSSVSVPRSYKYINIYQIIDQQEKKHRHGTAIITSEVTQMAFPITKFMKKKKKQEMKKFLQYTGTYIPTNFTFSFHHTFKNFIKIKQFFHFFGPTFSFQTFFSLIFLSKNLLR